jgi:SAM-dependent methyltransferase
VDLAAGTGKLTRLLTGIAGRVVAVEPVRAMRAVLEQLVPEAEIVDGAAEAMPLDSASADAVFVGEAFHWFRAAEATAEIARVLRPGGGLAVLWNPPGWIRDGESWLGELGDLLERHRDGGGFPTGEEEWGRVLAGGAEFAPFSHAEVEHAQRLGAGDFADLIGSWSWIATLPAPERDDVRRRVLDVVAGKPVVELRYVTQLYWARRR